MGKPITTDVPSCKETVDNGLNRFVILPRNVPGLVEPWKQS